MRAPAITPGSRQAKALLADVDGRAGAVGGEERGAAGGRSLG